MKKLHLRISGFLCLPVLLAISGCDHSVMTGTTVHDDGSLDRVVVLYDTDSAHVSGNFMGVSGAGGWTATLEPGTKSKSEKGKEDHVNATFTRHFDSVADANREMNRDTDTLFQIRSSFERENRWFYTYMEYSDTYRSLDRFKGVPKENYFTKEDYAFIDRLPAEGKPVTKADSLYLARLNEKIFDVYGARTIFEELFSGMLSTLDEYRVAPFWKDSLRRQKETIYKSFVNDGNSKEVKDELLAVIDHYKVPLPDPGRESIVKRSATMERRLEFISNVYSGKFQHRIRMPWAVVSSNADSVKGRELFWNPPVTKFLLNDYVMTARARKMNIWAVVISAGVVLLTIGLFFFRRKVGSNNLP